MTEKKKVRVLITVKTYPTFSVKYEEVVCTAGITDSGKWIRLYPVKYRRIDYAAQYKKYDWVEVDVVKSTNDFRPETHSVVGPIRRIAHVNTDNNWCERKTVVMHDVFVNLNKLVAAAHDKNVHKSLAVFKPSEVVDFTWMPTSREWDKNKLKVLDQLGIFEERGKRLQPVRKLPYKFLLRFRDDEGTESKMMIEDWEIGVLYWKCMQKHRNDEAKACADVKKKYFDDFAKTKDLHLFLGTTLQHHFKPQPFIIVGTFHPKKDTQTTLF